jgi:hypothetical protein
MSDDRLRLLAGAVAVATHNLGRTLANILGRAAKACAFDLRQVDGTSFDGKQAAFGLHARFRFVGPHGELFRLERARGGEALLVPLIAGDLEHNRHWLSVSMHWDPVPSKSRTPQLIYRSAQIAVYEAHFQSVDALQLVRAEWAGKRLAEEQGATEFDSGAAGHPHWHIDAVSGIKERLREQREEQRASERFREEFMRDAAEQRQYVDFDELLNTTRPAENAPPDYDFGDTLSSLHLAQCAPWHHQPWDGSVGVATPQAHNPSTFEEMASWVSSTVRYLRHEFEKAVGHG